LDNGAAGRHFRAFSRHHQWLPASASSTWPHLVHEGGHPDSSSGRAAARRWWSRLAQIVFFASTNAWMLDLDDRFAQPLMREGVALPHGISETKRHSSSIELRLQH